MRFVEGMLVETTNFGRRARFGVVRVCNTREQNYSNRVWADWRDSAKGALQAPESHESISAGGSLSYYTLSRLEEQGYKILSRPDLKPFEDWL